MSVRAWIGVAAVVLFAAVAGLATWWFVGSAEEAVDQQAAEDLASEIDGGAATGDVIVPAEASDEPITDVNGTWTVTGQDPDAVSDGSFVGYRINEILSGVANTVTGRTADVTGEITIRNDQLVAGAFEVQMASIATDQSQRDSQMRDRGYAYGTFPTSTFVVSEPVAVDAEIALAEQVQTIPVVGELSLHGVTRAVTIDLSASLVGSTLAVTGSVDITLADWDIDKPTGFRVADVDDVGVLELQLFFSLD